MSDLTKEYVAKMFHDLTTQIQQQNTQVVSQISELKNELTNYKRHIDDSIHDLKAENEALRHETKTLKDRLLQTERKAKEYNLIVYNLPGTNPSSEVIKLFRDKLNVNCREEDLSDTYRFNSKSANGKPEPILVEFISNNLKTKVLGEAKKLKNTGIYISLDYTPEDFQIKKALYSYQRTARDKGHTASIKGQTLVIAGVPYTLEALISNNPEAEAANNVFTGKSETENSVFKEETKNRMLGNQHQAEEPQPRKQKYLRSSSTINKQK
ncbi:unnamed protein product [Phaedon cochleariae]|uniref:Uncharacterized protein n=1 Tax=Phaedon cochleariae TaxID=80249 RepID=A0A9N9SL08_PHACE|nr:unnamed protein product [Phaedon cochleariae]